MKYRLVVDRGNSACKWAFFEAENLTAPVEVVHTLSDGDIPELQCGKYAPEACICSNVGKPDERLESELRRLVPRFLKYSSGVPVPIGNNYRTPSTLGPDRLAAAVGAWTLAPGKPSLIVDMGTAVTYDLLTADGIYLGGNIAPGLWLRFESLHNHTAALPLVDASSDFPEMGYDTRTAILSGVMEGVWLELQGYMARYKARYPELLTFLTGGDMKYFDNRTKNGIFAAENLVLIGLNRILHENVTE